MSFEIEPWELKYRDEVLEKDTQWMRNELERLKRDLNTLLMKGPRNIRESEISKLSRRLSIVVACLSNPKYITVIIEREERLHNSRWTSRITDIWVKDTTGKRTDRPPTYPSWMD